MQDLRVADMDVFKCWLEDKKAYLISLIQEPEEESLQMEYWYRLVNLAASRWVVIHILWLLMILKSAKYPLTTINKLLDVFGDNQAIGSDIGCSLSKMVAASSIWDKATNQKLLLSVNAFHGHTHNGKCQLQYHPMYLHGFRLEDLKTYEQIFTSSNSAACLICHISHFHYGQFLDLHSNQWDMDR